MYLQLMYLQLMYLQLMYMQLRYLQLMYLQLMYLQSHIYKNIPVSFDFITIWNQEVFLCSLCIFKISVVVLYLAVHHKVKNISIRKQL